ncbi:16S rRNA (cytidine(1402)-2'-O)-methyltransferase [Candidatus Epulonipiscium viviparus]|uniref:16S rRNA (cytidine(1402)-2'-O)-methyltransferase n=1 Tax=Candidatus Epulonipiscium viviparus TaxID=420336 RepID=UPI000495C9CA|nr:16S rRNA (cytidine(1402)-2'-O)-methyltransferase [Candidatus Epulopiscium viviparus]
MLTLCATPIGNLADISLRTLEILKESDLILCEDTRVSIRLLNHYNITARLESYHEHNKNSKTASILRQLREGKSIALVTDAGTPGISDPGEDLVRACAAEGISVTATPGPVAFVVALILSGKSTRRFVFEGFLPSDKKERLAVVASLVDETRTIILYESPHRITKTLSLLLEHLGNRNITLARELTKKFETLIHSTISDAIVEFESTTPKGEFVVIIEGKDANELKADSAKKWINMSFEAHMDLYLKQGFSEKDAMKKVATDRAISKRDVYAQLKIN